ncbi:MAG: hypothetical protein JO257_37360 [Deltaproteobacteria bacterium]|nr:hypothetical protein [Deltaproteobacteria bacterium]
MRTLLAALAAVACSKPAAPQTASADARRELRVRSLEAELQVIATQPVIINTMARVFPLTEAARARVTEKLTLLQMRFDEAKNALRDPDEAKATEAMKRLEAARKDAWDALDKAPRTDRST